MDPANFLLEMKVGKNALKPAPLELTEKLQKIEVTQSDEGRSGFQMTFQASHGESQSEQDYPLLSESLLDPFNRVIVTVTINSMPSVLMDGIITHHQLIPGGEAKEPLLIVTGEDVSIMMDLEEKTVGHPNQDEASIARTIISGYSDFGLTPQVQDPPLIDRPDPNERTPIQHGTDLGYLLEMAKRYGYVFYVTPGPASEKNTAYWGPPRKEGEPQAVLSVNLGPATNVESISFRYDALTPTTVTGRLQDRRTNEVSSVEITESKRPKLAEKGMSDQAHVRQVLFRGAGLKIDQAQARAQGVVDASVDRVAIAEGMLDALTYGDILRPYELVTLRGARHSYDGLWYVKRVTHTIQPGGEYKQHFTLTREGVGSTIQKVET